MGKIKVAAKVAKGVEWDKNISIESPLLSLKISTSSNKVYYLKYTSEFRKSISAILLILKINALIQKVYFKYTSIFENKSIYSESPTEVYLENKYTV